MNAYGLRKKWNFVNTNILIYKKQQYINDVKNKNNMYCSCFMASMYEKEQNAVSAVLRANTHYSVMCYVLHFNKLNNKNNSQCIIYP